MNKIGRNEKCPCGSGKKYKVCCGSTANTISISDIGGATFIRSGKELKQVVVKKDFVLNQIWRDSPQIARKFDNLCRDNIISISEIASKIATILFYGITDEIAATNPIKFNCALLLQNALQTIMASLEVMRSGYRLQPGILFRSVLEILSTVIYLCVHPEKLDDLKNGKLNSTKTISEAKKVFPHFGRIYGLYSNQFVHLGDRHRALIPLSSYEKDDDALKENLLSIKLMSWMLYVVSELLFIDDIEVLHFWKIINKNKFQYSPRPDAKKWQEIFLELEEINAQTK